MNTPTTINGRTPEEIKRGLEVCIGKSDLSEDYCDRCPYLSDASCRDALEIDALAYIQLLEPAQPKWISVEERLPEDLEEVLILVKETEFYGQYKEFSKSYFCQYMGCIDDGEWYTVWCNGHRYIKDTAKEPYADKLEVTHWTPLPELPEEDNDD